MSAFVAAVGLFANPHPMPGWIWSNRTMISKSLQAKLSQSAVWKGWTKSTFLLRCEPAETQYYYFNIRENNFSNNCESITKIKDKMISLSFTVLGVMLPSLDSKEEKWNKTRPRYSMYDLQTHLCVDTSTHRYSDCNAVLVLIRSPSSLYYSESTVMAL